MSTYQHILPDGSTIAVPVTMSPEQADEYAKRVRPQAFAAAQQTRPREGFFANMGKGARGVVEDVGLGIGATVGDEQTARQAYRAAQARDSDIKTVNWADVEKEYKEKGATAALSKLPGFARDSIAGALPGMAVTLAGAGVGAKGGAALGALGGPAAPITVPVGTAIGALVGGAGASLPMFYGSNLGRQDEASPDKPLDKGAAIGAAVPQAALDSASNLVVLGKLFNIGKLGGLTIPALTNAPKEVIERKLVEASQQSLFKAARKGAGLAVAAEVPTEVAQQVLERAQAGLPLLDDDAMQEYRASAAGALVVAAPFGGAGGIRERSGAKAFVKQQEETAAQKERDARLAQEQQERQRQQELLKTPDGILELDKQANQVFNRLRAIDEEIKGIQANGKVAKDSPEADEIRVLRAEKENIRKENATLLNTWRENVRAIRDTKQRLPEIEADRAERTLEELNRKIQEAQSPQERQQWMNARDAFIQQNLPALNRRSDAALADVAARLGISPEADTETGQPRKRGKKGAEPEEGNPVEAFLRGEQKRIANVEAQQKKNEGLTPLEVFLRNNGIDIPNAEEDTPIFGDTQYTQTAEEQQTEREAQQHISNASGLVARDSSIDPEADPVSSYVNYLLDNARLAKHIADNKVELPGLDRTQTRRVHEILKDALDLRQLDKQQKERAKARTKEDVEAADIEAASREANDILELLRTPTEEGTPVKSEQQIPRESAEDVGIDWYATLRTRVSANPDAFSASEKAKINALHELLVSLNKLRKNADLRDSAQAAQVEDKRRLVRDQINDIFSGGIANPEGARAIADIARALGFDDGIGAINEAARQAQTPAVTQRDLDALEQKIRDLDNELKAADPERIQKDRRLTDYGRELALKEVERDRAIAQLRQLREDEARRNARQPTKTKYPDGEGLADRLTQAATGATPASEQDIENEAQQASDRRMTMLVSGWDAFQESLAATAEAQAQMQSGKLKPDDKGRVRRRIVLGADKKARPEATPLDEAGRQEAAATAFIRNYANEALKQIRAQREILGYRPLSEKEENRIRRLILTKAADLFVKKNSTDIDRVKAFGAARTERLQAELYRVKQELRKLLNVDVNPNDPIDRTLGVLRRFEERTQDGSTPAQQKKAVALVKTRAMLLSQLDLPREPAMLNAVTQNLIDKWSGIGEGSIKGKAVKSLVGKGNPQKTRLPIELGTKLLRRQGSEEDTADTKYYGPNQTFKATPEEQAAVKQQRINDIADFYEAARQGFSTPSGDRFDSERVLKRVEELIANVDKPATREEVDALPSNVQRKEGRFPSYEGMGADAPYSDARTPLRPSGETRQGYDVVKDDRTQDMFDPDALAQAEVEDVRLADERRRETAAAAKEAGSAFGRALRDMRNASDIKNRVEQLANKLGARFVTDKVDASEPRKRLAEARAAKKAADKAADEASTEASRALTRQQTAVLDREKNKRDEALRLAGRTLDAIKESIANAREAGRRLKKNAGAAQRNAQRHAELREELRLFDKALTATKSLETQQTTEPSKLANLNRAKALAKQLQADFEGSERAKDIRRLLSAHDAGNTGVMDDTAVVREEQVIRQEKFVEALINAIEKERADLQNSIDAIQKSLFGFAAFADRNAYLALMRSASDKGKAGDAAGAEADTKEAKAILDRIEANQELVNKYSAAINKPQTAGKKATWLDRLQSRHEDSAKRAIATQRRLESLAPAPASAKREAIDARIQRLEERLAKTEDAEQKRLIQDAINKARAARPSENPRSSLENKLSISAARQEARERKQAQTAAGRKALEIKRGLKRGAMIELKSSEDRAAYRKEMFSGATAYQELIQADNKIDALQSQIEDITETGEGKSRLAKLNAELKAAIAAREEIAERVVSKDAVRDISDAIGLSARNFARALFIADQNTQIAPRRGAYQKVKGNEPRLKDVTRRGDTERVTLGPLEGVAYRLENEISQIEATNKNDDRLPELRQRLAGIRRSLQDAPMSRDERRAAAKRWYKQLSREEKASVDQYIGIPKTKVGFWDRLADIADTLVGGGSIDRTPPARTANQRRFDAAQNTIIRNQQPDVPPGRDKAVRLEGIEGVAKSAAEFNAKKALAEAQAKVAETESPAEKRIAELEVELAEVNLELATKGSSYNRSVRKAEITEQIKNARETRANAAEAKTATEAIEKNKENKSDNLELKDRRSTLQPVSEAAKEKAAKHELNGMTLAEASQWLLSRAKATTNPIKRALIKRVADSLRQQQGRVEFRDSGPLESVVDGRPYVIHGKFLTQSKTIVLNNRLFDENSRLPRDLDSVLLHELVHAATVAGIATDATLAYKIDDLAERVKKWMATDQGKKYLVGKNKNSLEYAVSNAKEFVAETFSNPEFQDMLRQIPASKTQSQFDRFVQFVGRLFGATTPRELGALAEAIQLTDEAMTATEALPANFVVPETEPVEFYLTAPWGKSGDDATDRAAKTMISKGNTEQRKAILSNIGLNFRVRAVDAVAAMRKAIEKGDYAAAVQFNLDIMNYGQRNHFVEQAVHNGAPTRSLFNDKTKGKQLQKVEIEDGASLRGVVQRLKEVKGYGDMPAVTEAFTMLAAAKRAQTEGWDRVFADTPMPNNADAATQARINAQNADKAAARARADALARELDAGKSPFAAAYNEYQEYNKNLLKFVRDSGVISDEEFRRLSSKGNYTPLFREGKRGDIILDIDAGRTITVGRLADEPQLKKMLAGSDKILDFFTASVRNTSVLIDAALHNFASRNAAFSLKALGAAEPVGNSAKGDDIIEFRINGAPQRFRIDTEGLGIPTDLVVKGFAGVPSSFPGIVRMLGVPADWTRKLVTRNPVYMARQLIRDPMAAWFTTGAKFNPVIDTVKEVSKAMRGEADKRLERRGVTGGMLYAEDFSDVENLQKKLAGDTTAASWLFAKLEEMAHGADSVTRRNVFNGALKEGASEAEAMLAAYEAMPFSKRGSSPSIRMVNHMVPFLSAAIQGWDVAYRAAKGDMPLKERLNVRNRLIMRGAMVAGLTLLYAAAMSDNEEYKNANTETRLNNWFIPVGEGTTIKLPIPFELGVIFKMLPEALYRIGGEDAEAGRELSSVFKAALQMAPVGGVPQAIKPMIEATLNRSFFTGRAIEPEGSDTLDIGERTTRTTTELSKALGFDFDLFGKQYGISPATLEYVANQYTAGVYGAIAGVVDNFMPAPTVEKPTRTLAELPLFKAVLLQEDEGGQVNRLYDQIERMARYANTHKKMIERGDFAGAQKYLEDNREEFVKGQIANKAKAAIDKINAAENDIRASDMSPDKKKLEIDRLKSIRNRLAQVYSPMLAN